jgi:hypothetical protein
VLNHIVSPLRYADLIALALAAPPLLLTGTSAAGYAVGALTWLVIRGLGLALETTVGVATQPAEQAALWLGYRLARIILLAAATIAVRLAFDNNAAVTTLAVIASAFTIQLLGSLIARYGRARHSAAAGY